MENCTIQKSSQSWSKTSQSWTKSSQSWNFTNSKKSKTKGQVLRSSIFRSCLPKYANLNQNSTKLQLTDSDPRCLSEKFSTTKTNFCCNNTHKSPNTNQPQIPYCKSQKQQNSNCFTIFCFCTPSPSIIIAKSKDEVVNIIQRMNNLFVLFFSWTTSKYHNYKVPKKEQAIISKRWTTSLLCSFPEQSPNYHNCKIQRMDKNLFGVFLSPVSNQFGTYVYCEQPEHCHTKGWATSMFVIPCEQPPIFSLKFFSKLEMC